ncbi:sulfotransferase [Pseudohaliea sp.]|uniref:tetratricopeptide repeat-containing sulfotransferase family protein n=1 Tax=Pseudohaliea sp. TaxID=2740289 RepID=UPI0032EAD7FC
MQQTPARPAAPWMQDALREGFTHLNAGRVNEASRCCKKVLDAKPDLVEGHFLVGLIALEIKQTGNAIRAFGSVTQLKPTHGAAWANLASLFVRAGQAGRADAALAKAVEHAEENPVVLDLIGTVHGQLGEQEEAGRWFQRALEKNPESVTHQINLANNHMFLDRLTEAETLLGKVLKAVPNHPQAHWLVSGLRKATDRRHIETLEALVTQTRNPRGLAFLYYAMGKELEDLEAWDDAFRAFERGAGERRKTLDFDESREVAMFRAFAETFTREWLESGPAGNEDPSPIFVVGQPRTGTTLIERIIVAHSQVHSAGELRQFGHCLRRLGDYREANAVSPKLAELGASIDPGKLGGAYLQTTARLRGDTPRFVDKLPPNYLYIPLILKALPNARIVHVRRSPMDACFASFKQLFADAYPHSYEQEEMARHHARYFKLMETWRERFGDRFHDISYEDTAANLEPNARALIDFLGLPWEDACLHFHEQSGAVTTASSVQVRQPAHTRSVGRWRRYEQQLRPMRDALEREGIPLGLNGGQ